MELYLIRHADALALGVGGTSSDAERPLSEEGVAQGRLLAEGLRRQGVQLELVLSSPLVRARQTAEEMLRYWAAPPRLQACEELAPGGRSRRLAKYLRGVDAERVALVGHQPDLGLHAAWLIGSKKAQIEVAKAGVLFIHCPGVPGKGCGELRWLVTPAWLTS